jgi:hypothetical protein
MLGAMTEAERHKEKIAAARSHPGLAAAMATPPPTWLGIAVVVTAVMALSIVLTLALYPWDDLEKMPEGVRMIMMVSWLPTIGAVVGVLWLLFDAIGLASGPTRHVLAVVEPRAHTPAPYYLRLATEDGGDREYRARRRAASMVKVGVITPGDVGVAVFKGDVVVEWVPLPPVEGRTYDRY